jgi:hypothetical protein
MPRQSKRLRGGLSQMRRNLIPLLQDQENVEKEVTDPSLLTLKVRDAKEYLKQDLQECIRVLQFKLDALDQPANHDDMLWSEYVNKEIEAMTYMSKGKSIKGLTGAIAAYNAFSKGQDKFRSVDRQKTAYPCGTVTCKERGQKIKEALTVLATLSPDALGAFGMSSAFTSAFDWATSSKSQNINIDKATFLRLPPELIEDVTDSETPAKTPTEIELAPLPSTNPQPQPEKAPAKSWFSWSGGRRTRRR